MNALAVLAVVAALAAAFGLAIKSFALRGLTCTRAFSRPAFFAGEEGEMIEVVRNDRPMLIPWLRVESRISPHLRLGRQENLDVAGDRYYCSLFTLMPYQQVRRRHRVGFLHRGEFDLGNVALTAGDMLGIVQASREQQMKVPVLVYPRLLDEREIPAPLNRMMEETVRRRLLLTDPFLVRGIRPYQPGDPVRDIHWPATARMGEPMVCLHDPTGQLRLMVLFNGEYRAGQWSERLSEPEEEAVEWVISLAATLCLRGLRAGLPVGFAANLVLGEKKESAVLLPDTGPAREEELLSAMARLRLLRTLSFPMLLETLSGLQGLDLLVISRFDSDAIEAALAPLRQRNRVRLFILDEGAGA